MFDVKTMNSLRVMAITAGMESRANITSVVSTISSTRNIGVACRRPLMVVKKSPPWKWFVTGMNFRASFTAGFFSGSKLMEMFGVKEIQVGDPALDAAWFVRTNQPDFLAAALVPSIRARLLAEPAIGRSARYKLEQGPVHYAEQGSLATPAVLERLERQLPLLQELADVAEVFAGTKV